MTADGAAQRCRYLELDNVCFAAGARYAPTAEWGRKRTVRSEDTWHESEHAMCSAHACRKLVEITRNGTAPIADEGVKRIGDLYRIEADLRGFDPQARLAVRQARSTPLVADMQAWLVHHRARVATKSPLGEALAYIAKYWDGLKLFLTDGRIEIDNTQTLIA